MTKVKKLPGGSKIGGAAADPRVKIAAAGVLLVLLLGISGVVFFASPSSTTTTTDSSVAQQQQPQPARVRSKNTSTAAAMSHKTEAMTGVHRYEMILGGLTKQQQSKDGNEESTTTGRVILETYDDWAPIGASHFDKLVTNRFYDECRFFRVVDNFVVQFGINGDPQVQKKWRNDVLKDDPVKETNAYGTVTYATSGPDTRTVQLFINTNPRGNGRLDGMGFAPFGRIVEGMEFVERVNDEYHEKPAQGKIQDQGNAYLDREFPRLSYIERVRSLDDGTT